MPVLKPPTKFVQFTDGPFAGQIVPWDDFYMKMLAVDGPLAGQVLTGLKGDPLHAFSTPDGDSVVYHSLNIPVFSLGFNKYFAVAYAGVNLHQFSVADLMLAIEIAAASGGLTPVG